MLLNSRLTPESDGPDPEAPSFRGCRCLLGKADQTTPWRFALPHFSRGNIFIERGAGLGAANLIPHCGRRREEIRG
jgi:hypothetical protein